MVFKNNIQIRKKFYFLFFSLSFFSLIVYSLEIYDGIRKAKEYIFILTAILNFSITAARSCFHNIRIRISYLDTAVLAFTLYILLNSIYFGNNLNLILLTSFILFYFNIKIIIHNSLLFRDYNETITYIIYLTLTFSLLVGFYSYLQMLGIINSFHNFVSVTGPFNNPGPFGGYIAFNCVLIFGVLAMRNSLSLSKAKVRILMFALVILIPIVIQSYSRAAWISIIISSIYIFYNDLTSFFRLFIIKKKNRYYIYAITIFLFTLLLYSLINLKLNSALGRLFIWKISYYIFQDNLFFGVGVNNFSHSYYDYQATFFSQNNYSNIEYFAASNPEYCFNELLRILVELGLVGFIFYVITLYYTSKLVINSYSNNISNEAFSKIFVGGVYSIIIFSFFSYPFSELPFLFCICLSISIISSRQTDNIYSFILSKKYYKFYILFIILLNLSFIKKIKDSFTNYKTWEKANISVMLEDFNTANILYGSAKKFFQNRSEYLVDYGVSLYSSQRYKECINVLTEASPISGSYIVDLTLAQSYSSIGQASKAEKHFIKAINNYPSLFYPKYAFLQHYVKYNNVAKALEVAFIIKNMPVKIPSPMVEDIQQKSTMFLQKRCLDPLKANQ